MFGVGPAVNCNFAIPLNRNNEKSPYLDYRDRCKQKFNTVISSKLTFCLLLKDSDRTAYNAILNAMRVWNHRTCIVFKPRASERDYVHFFKGSG